MEITLSELNFRRSFRKISKVGHKLESVKL